MAINFPDSPSAGDPHTEAGVTWTYDGEKWVSNNTAAPAALWTRAGTVLSPATAGDDVDLGTGDLSAAAGTFSGQLTTAFDQPSGFVASLVNQSTTGGDILYMNARDSGSAIVIQRQSDNQNSFILRGDGQVQVGNDGSGNPNITLGADGSATFSGDVTSNVFYRTQSSGDPFGNILVSQLDGQDRLRIRADGEIAIGTTNIGNTPGINFLVSPDGTTKIGGSVATSPNITLNANGIIQTTNAVEWNVGTANQGQLAVDGTGCIITATGGLGFETNSRNVTGPSVFIETGGGMLIGQPGQVPVNPTIILNQTGAVYKPGGGTWTDINSERRLKQNLVPVDPSTAWDTIKNLPYYSYEFISDPEKTYYGPVVDECPADMQMDVYQTNEEGESVLRSDEQGPLRTYDNQLRDARMFVALQTALTRIEALEAEVQALKGGS